jgi:hypothetical protein
MPIASIRVTPGAVMTATVLALALACAGGASADAQATWARIGDPPNPSVFTEYAAAYDSSGDRVLVYNPAVRGDDQTVQAADVWEFSPASPASGWHRLVTSGSAPIGRTFASLVVDEPNHRLLLYGGGTPSLAGTPVSNDLYALSLTGTPTWSLIPTTSDTMRTRYSAFMCLDAPTRRLVVYGGMAANGLGFRVAGDVWTLPLDGVPVWTATPVTGTVPASRTNAQIAWDAAGSRLLVHGGGNPTTFATFADTWALSIGATAHWDALATTGEQVPREFGGAVVDAQGDRLVLAPGATGTDPPPASELAPYMLPLGPGGEWSQLPASRAFDRTNFACPTVHDTRRNRLVTVGSALLQSLALADGSGWQRLWPPDPPTAPEATTGSVLVSDPAHSAIWSVGGSEVGGFGDLWKLDPAGPATWTWYPQPSPVPAAGLAAALDAAGHRIVVASFGYLPAKLFTLGTDGVPIETEWTTTRDTFPYARVDHSLVVDPVRGRLLIFGGQFFGPHYNGQSFADVWAVPLGDLTAWTKLAPSGPTPPARGAHFAFYDDVRDRMVVFGGWGQTGGPIRNVLHDAWALSLSGTPTWSPLDGAAWDPPATGSLTYDPVTHRLFLFHGDDWSLPPAGAVYMRGVEDDGAWMPVSADGDAPAFTAPIAYAPW